MFSTFERINLPSLVQIGALPSYNANQVEDITIFIPSKNEQKKIGQLFDQLDSLITLHQRKCDQLGDIKEALLEKMFPSKNEYTPRIRFKGFTDAWEQRKYGDIAELSRGLTYSPSNIVEHGTRVLRSSNINEDYFVKSDDDVFVEDGCININYAKDGDILITSANGSSR